MKRAILSILFLTFIGFIFSTTIEQANDFIVETVLDNNLEYEKRVWVYPEIIHQGDIIATYMGDIQAPIDGYLYYIDDKPGALFTHPVRFVFVSKDLDDYRIIDWNFPPDFLIDMTELTKWWKEPELNLPDKEDYDRLKSRLAPAEEMDSENLYAVLVNGGGSMSSNYMAFYIDLAWCYSMLKEVYGYSQDNIYILCSDGLDPSPDRVDGSNSPPDMDGDGIDDIGYAATWEDFNTVISELDSRLEGDELLYFFYIDHGTDVDSLITGLCMWDGIYNDHEFAELIEPLECRTKLVTVTACFSGGFIDDFEVMDNTVINTAARFDEYAWGMPGDIHGFYSYYILSALSGEAPLGEHDPLTADTDGNGFISIYESYQYACLHDESEENPQYASNPPDLGGNTYIFGSSFNQPNFECESPYFTDSEGDGDGILDPGESIVYHPNIYSNGDTAYNLDVELECDDPMITIEAFHFTRDIVIPDDTDISAEIFEFSLADEIPWGHVFDMNISFHAGTTATDLGSYARDFPILLEVISPDIQVESYTISEVEGDGDGILDPGETVDVNLVICNDSPQELDDVSLLCSGAADGVEVIEGDASYGDIASNSTSSSTDRLRVRVGSDFSANDIAPFNLQITGDRDYYKALPFALQVGNYFIPEDDPGVWIADGWHLSNKRMINNMHSWYNGNEGNFVYDNSDTMNLTSCTFVIPPDDPVLIFDQFLAAEKGYDRAKVQISNDGGLCWHTLIDQSEFKSSWTSKMLEIPEEFAGGLGKIRFSFESNRSVRGEGWYLSNIHVIPKPQAYVGSGYCFPFVGGPDMEYGFHVTYYNTDLLPLTSATLVVDGVDYEMTTLSGMASTGIRYYTTVTLGEGNHSWHCEMRYDGGFERYPRTGEFDGPFALNPVQTFEIGHFDEFFEHSGTNDVWEYGVPSGASGEEIPYGTNVWGTNIDGFFPCGLEGTACRLETQPIPLLGEMYPVVMIYQWYETESFINSMVQGGGNVKVSVDGGEPFVVMPEPRVTAYDFIGYDAIAASGNAQIGWEQGFGSAVGNFWHPVVFDLSFIDGDEFKVIFDFGASVTCDASTSELGWYINNVFVFNKAFSAVEENRVDVPEMKSIEVSPNPFNAKCQINLKISDDQKPKSILIYDIAGKLVHRKIINQPNIGEASFTWDAHDVSSGVYFIRTNESSIEPAKVLLIK
ncbi:MAG: T9SS type A sorting domain-containing protein [Candidatus Zixiibacteriota bacterium]